MSEESRANYLIELPKKIMEDIENVARERHLNKEQKVKLEEEVRKSYEMSSFEPGEAIGIIAAQSISEPATQMTMRTYHFAGSVGIKIIYGLPRLMEIFDAKRTPEIPVMTIFLKKQFNNKENAARIAGEIFEKKVKNISKKVSINLSDKAIEIELMDMKRAGRLANMIKEELKGAKTSVRSKDIVVSVAGDVDVKELEKVKEKIVAIHIDGIEGISNAVVRREGEEWIINTIGSNLKRVMAIEEVDENRTITNDIHEIASVLGIEAARNSIMEEAIKTMQEQGLDVDTRHIMLVGDLMTFTGEIKSIGRYGVAGTKSSILARAAFEETIKHLVKASIRNESDSFQGIFENVMIGQVIPSGTGMFDVVSRFERVEEK